MVTEPIDVGADLAARRRQYVEGLIAYFVLETDPRPRLLDVVNNTRFNKGRAPLGWSEVLLVLDGSVVKHPATFEMPPGEHMVVAIDLQTSEAMGGRLKRS